MSSEDYEGNGYGYIANHGALVACFMPYKKWVSRENCPFKTRSPYVMWK